MLPAFRPQLRRTLTTAVVAFCFAASPGSLRAQDIPTPEAFFGFRMGADRQLARWDRMVEYYRLLDGLSDRLQVLEMGPTTLGNPFLALFISSPDNLAQL